MFNFLLLIAMLVSCAIALYWVLTLQPLGLVIAILNLLTCIACLAMIKV